MSKAAFDAADKRLYTIVMKERESREALEKRVAELERMIRVLTVPILRGPND